MNEIVEELLTRLSEDQREDFEERAAIMQYDGGLTRDHAECLALLVIMRNERYLIGNTNPKEETKNEND